MSNETRKKAMSALLGFRDQGGWAGSVIDAIVEHVREDTYRLDLDRRIADATERTWKMFKDVHERLERLEERTEYLHALRVRDERLMAEQDAEPERQVIGMRDRHGDAHYPEHSWWGLARKIGDPEDPSVWDAMWSHNAPHTPIYAEDATSEPDAPTPDSGLGREPLVLKSDADARIAELRAENARLRQGRDRSLEIELREQKDAALAEIERLKAERGPVVAYRDGDGLVWAPFFSTGNWCARGMGVRTLNQIARKFGPLTALHEGEPLEWDGDGEGEGDGDV